MTEFINVLIHIYIDIVNIKKRGRAKYLTPQLKLNAVHVL